MAKYVGVDLGTANTLVYCDGKGIVLNEPSVVAIDKETGTVLAVGKEAGAMIGRTPENVTVLRPLKDGVIADFDTAHVMLKTFLEKACPREVLKPKVTVCVPFGVTEVEKRAVLEAVERTGGTKAVLIEEPMAAALGADLPVSEATGSMVADIGGGTSEVAVVSLGGIVVSTSLRCGGDKMDRAILTFVKEKYGVLIGTQTAETIKISIGSAHPSVEDSTISVMGRDLFSGLPKLVTVTAKEVREALTECVARIVWAVRVTLEQTPPELVADIVARGIYLTGGGANLKGLDKLIQEQTGIQTFVAENAQSCVAQGTGKSFSAESRKKQRGKFWHFGAKS